MRRRISDYGIKIGTLPPGEENAITDVEGVRVGHLTLNEGAVKTGVTAVIPHPGSLFREKLPAAVHVMNGFAKPVGTVQVEELGELETPIVLTNTLSVGTATDALISYMLDRHPEIGDTASTVNPLVFECNDGYLNDIRGQHVKKEHVLQALEQAETHVDEGAVGAGTGMSCFGLKGGIGTASRLTDHGMLGVLVLTNFGKIEDLLIDGRPIGREWADGACEEPDQGSIIVVVASEAGLTSRQLKRVIKRTAVGIARTGSFVGHGSGEIAIGFSTKRTETGVNETELDGLFRAAAEATEEAILNSLAAAETTVGRDGRVRRSLQELAARIL
ncbi:MAG TPA: P1 family peptidase [Bacillales bacterium]|nr:P1 family peptidase [Bacillales bacterium]